MPGVSGYVDRGQPGVLHQSELRIEVRERHRRVRRGSGCERGTDLARAIRKVVVWIAGDQITELRVGFIRSTEAVEDLPRPEECVHRVVGVRIRRDVAIECGQRFVITAGQGVRPAERPQVLPVVADGAGVDRRAQVLDRTIVVRLVCHVELGAQQLRLDRLGTLWKAFVDLLQGSEEEIRVVLAPRRARPQELEWRRERFRFRLGKELIVVARGEESAPTRGLVGVAMDLIRKALRDPPEEVERLVVPVPAGEVRCERERLFERKRIEG
jgi:hypothetical protein